MLTYAALLVGALLLASCSRSAEDRTLRFVSTIAGQNGEFGETFGVAAKDGDVYVSDGQNGKIWRVHDGETSLFASGLGTPSGIAFAADGSLIVADAGTSAIYRVDVAGTVSILAGVPGSAGFADGETASALFNHPVGVATSPDGKVFVADTYNDRIRLIYSGRVVTLAGRERGFVDGEGARFDTPASVALLNNTLLVADTGNRRIRVVEPYGVAWTLAGTGADDLKDGINSQASFEEPTSIAVDSNGSIYVGDGSAVRMISGLFPVVRTISASSRGTRDGALPHARFSGITGLAVANDGSVMVADSENRLVRRISHDRGDEMTKDRVTALRGTAEQFRNASPGRWPFDPPERPREIAGTMGEIRGELTSGDSDVWFHNGLDIAGAYGETARFVRDEKVLRVNAVENFDNRRESIRMPTMGYVHIRLGRDQDNRPFDDGRFQFSTDDAGKLRGVRIPRGSAFHAGEAIGTLNAMNHVHLIAGRSGSEMNALDALLLPGVSDSWPPKIEKATFYANNAEINPTNGHLQLSGKVKVTMRAYDQVDGNADRRRLGLYQAGYQVLRDDRSPVTDILWNIRFDRMPSNAAVPFVYAVGSKSGATGETLFDYIVTNPVEGDTYSESWLDTSTLGPGKYIIRVWAGDYFGNNSYLDTAVEIAKRSN